MSDLSVERVHEEPVPRLRVVPLEVLAGAGEVDAPEVRCYCCIRARGVTNISWLPKDIYSLHADVQSRRGQRAGGARQRLGRHPAGGRRRRGHLFRNEDSFDN